ncbi:MAG: dihydropteroate synthase [Burkholderiales bacterium]|nr:dihydropteroate synthase [Burkholderiales bacterium]
MKWQTSRFLIDVSMPQVMGIVNITPDSFSDGGRWAGPAAAMRHCDTLVAQGADILDLGAESSRPGAAPVPLELELQRLMPVLAYAVTLGVPVSVDTCKPEVMHAALDAGADIINDIWALRQPWLAGGVSAAQAVAAHPTCGVCLMHMHRNPADMQQFPMQGDVVVQVKEFLQQRVVDAQALGIKNNRIFVDPGIGFGKTAEQNLALLARQSELAPAGVGLLAGWSRKSSLAVLAASVGAELGATDVASDRLVPSVVAALLAIQRGARVVRVHDVKETVQMVRLWQAVGSVPVASAR